jgi:hypothetical protein
LNVLAATTSAGKSALAANIAARGQRNGTLLLSVEMTREEIIRRLIADLGTVDWSLIARRRPPLPEGDEAKRIARAAERLTAMPLEVHYRRRLTPADVRREGHFVLPRFNGNLDLIVVDYLQLMDPDAPQKRRDLEIASITKELKNIAGELKVPILLLSQLNREAVKTETGEPESLALTRVRRDRTGQRLRDFAVGRPSRKAGTRGNESELENREAAERHEAAPIRAPVRTRTYAIWSGNLMNHRFQTLAGAAGGAIRGICRPIGKREALIAPPIPTGVRHLNFEH